MLYVLLVSYRSKHPECYPRLTKEETKAGEKIARLLEESASKSAGIQRCLSSAPFSYYTPSIMAKFDEGS